MTLIYWVLLYGRYLVNIWGVLCLHVFVICSGFILSCYYYYYYYYYLISMINFCWIGMFAKTPFKLRPCVKNGREGS